MMQNKPLTRVPEVEPDCISLSLSSEEIISLTQILAFAKEVFAQMSNDLFKEGNEKASSMYSARSQLSAILYNKFNALNNIGEPVSRDLH